MTGPGPPADIPVGAAGDDRTSGMHGVQVRVLSLREPGPGPLGQTYGRVLAEQDVACGPGEVEGQDTFGAEAVPPGASALVGRGDEAAPAAPVDVGDLPAAPREQQSARALTSSVSRSGSVRPISVWPFMTVNSGGEVKTAVKFMKWRCP